MTYLLLILSVLLGGFLAHFTKIKSRHDLLLTFSSAYLLGVVFYHLFPEAYQEKGALGVTGFFVLGGVFIQILLTSITQGIEHGHLHNSPDKAHFPYGIFLGLFLHAILEGMAITSNDHKLTQAMIVHKIPESVILYFFLIGSLKSKKKVVLPFFLFSLATPLGSLIGNHNFFIEHHSYLIALISGVFIHIATHILFESGDGKHKVKVEKLFMFLLGSFLSYLFS